MTKRSILSAQTDASLSYDLRKPKMWSKDLGSIFICNIFHTVNKQIKGKPERIKRTFHCQEAFAKFDTKRRGLVSTKVLGDLLRQIGINPTKEELQVGKTLLHSSTSHD